MSSIQRLLHIFLITSLCFIVTTCSSFGDSIPKDFVDSCDDEVVKVLAGPCSNAGRQWRISKAAGAVGAGPTPSSDAHVPLFDPSDPVDLSWYSSEANFSAGFNVCLYENVYTFKALGLGFIVEGNGQTKVNWAFANLEFNQDQSPLADLCLGFLPKNTEFSIERREGKDGKMYPFIVFTNGGFLGTYDGQSEYQIMEYDDDKFVVRSINYTVSARDSKTRGKFKKNGYAYQTLVPLSQN